MADTTSKKLYEFTAAGFFMGDHYKVGDTIRLLPAQAAYDRHRLKEVVPPAPAPAPVAKPSKSGKASE